MVSIKLFSIFTIVCLANNSVTCWKATLHRDTGFRGGSITVEGGGCVHLGKDFNDKTSSVNTHGGCVRIWQNSQCTGGFRDLYPGSGSHSNLGALGFNDRTTSVGPCPPSGRKRRSIRY